MSFLLSLKQSWSRERVLSKFLLNLLEIELLMVLTLNNKLDVIDDVENSIFPEVDSIESLNEGTKSLSIISILMLIANILLFGITFIELHCEKKSIFYSKKLHQGTVQFVKIFPYVGFVPLTVYELKFLQGENIGNKIISVFNVIFFIIWAEIELISSWSYRFKQVDFCNSRHSQQVPFLLTLAFLALRQFVSSTYCSIAYLVRSLAKLLIVFQFHQYQLIQKVSLFYGMYGVYFFVIVFTEDMVGTEVLAHSVYLAATIVCGSGICYFLLDPILLKLCHYRIEHGTQLNLMQQPESQPQNQNKKIRETQNILRILTTIFVQKQKYDDQDEDNQFVHWWQTYNRIIMIHKISCLKINCICKRKQITNQDELLVYTMQLLSLGRSLCNVNTKLHIPKLLSIYLLVEIAKKPLKAYYELIRFKQEKTTNDRQTLVQLDYLTKQTRQCFAQVFAKNKAMNQQLQLLKVIEYEELMSGLDMKLDVLMEDIILFYEIFLFPTAKVSKIKQESIQINTKKEQVERQFFNLILNYADSAKLNMMVTLFYNFIEIYRSKEGELRKIGSQQNIRKRIYHKADSNIFSPQYGSIYIDLVQERGKILNLTSNMCVAYGYTRQEMVGYNVKRFMPTIYARHHDRFLSNFVQKGKLRLLRSKQRVIFAKNKKKFIFPVNVRLKAEYLLENQFGSSSLINAVDTSSEFLMVGMNGKLEQITQGLYRKLFGSVYKDEVGKCSRLSVYKLIPTLNRLHDPSEQPSPNRIYEGLVVTSSIEQILTEKFRYARDIISTGNTIGGLNGNGSSTLTSKSKLSIISARTMIQSGNTEANQIYDTLAETFRVFLVDLSIMNLKGFKINYKVSNVHTSEFDLMIIEIISFEPVQTLTFYKMLLEQLRTTSQIYQLNELHGPVSQHLDDLQHFCEEKMNQSRKVSPLPIDILKRLSLTNPQPIFGEVQRRRQSYSSVNLTSIQQSEESLNSLISGKEQIGEIYEMYENSDQSSVLGNTEIESKRQLLLNAFNSSETIVSSRIGLLFTFLLLVLLLIKVTIGVLAFTFVNNNLDLWKDVRTMFLMDQVTTSWIAIEEVETFAQYWQSESPPWDEILKNEAIERMKASLEQLPLITEQPVQFYTQPLNFTNPTTNISTTMSLIELFNHYFYMMSYQNDINIEQIRLYRAQVRSIIQNFKLQRLAYNRQVELQERLKLFILISAYTFLLLIIHLFVLGIYLHYRSEQQRIVSLLSYMNRKEIKRQTLKLAEVKSFLKGKDTDSKHIINTLKMKDGIAITKKTTQQSQHQINTPRKSLKLELENDRSNNDKSLRKTRLILILMITFLFLSNFAIITFWTTSQSDNFFNINTNAAQVVFDFQNRVPILIGSILGGVNKAISTGTQVKFAENGAGRQKLFVPMVQLSRPSSINSPISKLTKQLFPSPLCSIVECENMQGYYGQISFDYLIYNFYKKFQILLPANGVMAGDELIKSWVNESNIPTLVNFLQQIIEFSIMINVKIDNQFSDESSYLSMVLIISFVIMVPFNILIVIYAQRKFFLYLNDILTSSEGLYMHFNVNVLSENTYLMTYFTSKIKNNK